MDLVGPLLGPCGVHEVGGLMNDGPLPSLLLARSGCGVLNASRFVRDLGSLWEVSMWNMCTRSTLGRH